MYPVLPGPTPTASSGTENMGFFTSMADQAFKKDERGNTLFFLGGPFSRPIVIEDEDRIHRTYTKHIWMLRVLFGLLILSLPVLFEAIPAITETAEGFITAIISLVIIQWIVQRVVFRFELHQLERRPDRLPLRIFYQQKADQHTSNGLLLGALACFLLLGVGIVMIFDKSSVETIKGIVFTTVCGTYGLAWAYALKLKIDSQGTRKRVDGDVS